jgi:hypothetical protein
VVAQDNSRAGAYLEEASELGGAVGDVALVLGERDDDVAEGEEALVDVRRLLELLAPHAAPLHALAARKVHKVQLRVDALRPHTLHLLTKRPSDVGLVTLDQVTLEYKTALSVHCRRWPSFRRGKLDDMRPLPLQRIRNSSSWTLSRMPRCLNAKHAISTSMKTHSFTEWNAPVARPCPLPA